MDSFEFRIQAGWGEGRTSATVMHGRHLPIPATDKRVVVPAFGALPQYSRRRPSTLAAVVRRWAIVPHDEQFATAHCTDIMRSSTCEDDTTAD